MSAKGTFGKMMLAGQMCDVVYVLWQTNNPQDDWYVNCRSEELPIVRCKLVKLLSRRPTESNPNIIQDAWSYQVLSEREFRRMAQGTIPRQTDTPQLGLF